METPLTPIEFARRARKLYGSREAVVDGGARLTYEQFLERCDRWSATLQQLGIRQGDRIAYIAPITPAQLESFYAVPQIGAVLEVLEKERAAIGTSYWFGERIGHADVAASCALRFTSEAHPQLFDEVRYPMLALHAARCEALPEFQEIVQPLAPPKG